MRTWKKNSETLEQTYGEKRPDIFKRPLIPLLVLFTAGILAGQFISLPGFLFLFPLFFLILILFIFPGLSNIIRLYCLLAAFFLTGIFLAVSQDGHGDLLQLFQGKRVTLEGTVVSSARTNGNIRRFELKTERNQGFHIYPNPGTSTVNIFLQDLRGIVRIEMYNLAGQKVISRYANLGTNNNLISLNTGNIPEGLYIINISGGGQKFAAKFIRK